MGGGCEGNRAAPVVDSTERFCNEHTLAEWMELDEAEVAGAGAVVPTLSVFGSDEDEPSLTFGDVCWDS